MQLPGEVWEAIRAYLAASGRLAGMQADSYIFAPLAEPGKAGENNTAESWVRGRYLSTYAILADLKLYGRLVGIPEEKLTLQALRRTATRLRMDEGWPIEEMKVFLDSREETKLTKFRLGKLPGLPEEEGRRGVIEAQVPDREGKPFKPGDGLTHGFHAQSLPEAEVLAMLAEDIQGIEEEIAGMDWLMRGIDAWRVRPLSLKDEMGLLDALTRTAFRLTEVRASAEQLQQGEEPDSGVEDIVEMFERMGIEEGEAGSGEKAREELYGGEPELDRRAVQIASVRCSLRRTLDLASRTEEVSVYLRLVEIYASGFNRLVRMLKSEGSDHIRAHRRLKEAIERGILDVNREYGRIP
jgi:hypothetical protein